MKLFHLLVLLTLCVFVLGSTTIARLNPHGSQSGENSARNEGIPHQTLSEGGFDELHRARTSWRPGLWPIPEGRQIRDSSPYLPGIGLWKKLSTAKPACHHEGCCCRPGRSCPFQNRDSRTCSSRLPNAGAFTDMNSRWETHSRDLLRPFRSRLWGAPPVSQSQRQNSLLNPEAHNGVRKRDVKTGMGDFFRHAHKDDDRATSARTD